jgi:hypothetical protein
MASLRIHCLLEAAFGTRFIISRRNKKPAASTVKHNLRHN